MSYQYLGEKTVKARKRHHCFICKCSIWPGATYRRSHHVYDGSAYQIKEHVECARVAAKWCADSGDYPDGYQGEDVVQEMEDALMRFGEDRNIYEIGDLTREERTVWFRFRRSQKRYEIKIAMKRDRWLTA